MAINIATPKPVEAVVPFILAPEMITVIAGLGTAAGIYFADNDAAKAWANRVYNNASNDFKGWIQAIADGGTFIATITGDMWDELKGHVNETTDCTVNYIGSNQVITYDNYSSFTTYTVNPVGLDILDISGIMKYQTGAGAIVTPKVKWTGGTTTLSAQISIAERYDSGSSHYYGHLRLIDYNSQTTDFTTEWPRGTDIPITVQVCILNGGSQYEIVVNGVSIGVKSFPWTCQYKEVYVAYGTGTISGFTNVATDLIDGVNYDIDQEIAANPAWDLTNKDVALPTTLDGVVGNHAEDIVTDTTVSDTVTIPDATTEIGLLGNIYNKIAGFFDWLKLFLSNLINNLVNAFRSLVGEFIPKIPDGIGAIFNPLWALITALLALFGRAIIFVTSLYEIPASSAMLNSNIIQGINFARSLNFQGVTLYGMIMAVCNLMLGLLVFNLFKRLVYSVPAGRR